MIFLVKEVCKDMVAFLLLLFYSVISFCVLFLALDYTHEKGGFWYYLEYSYLLELGEFNVKNLSTVNRFSFVISSIIGTIIMLNLLISIMGDTFDRVQEKMTEAGGKILAELILEIETLMIWRRNIGSKSYFTACVFDSVNENNDIWEGKISRLTRKIENSDKLTARKYSLLENQMNELKKDINKLKHQNSMNYQGILDEFRRLRERNNA